MVWEAKSAQESPNGQADMPFNKQLQQPRAREAPSQNWQPDSWSWIKTDTQSQHNTPPQEAKPLAAGESGTRWQTKEGDGRKKLYD